MAPNMINWWQPLRTVKDRCQSRLDQRSVNPVLNRLVVDIIRAFSAATTVTIKGQFNTGGVSS